MKKEKNKWLPVASASSVVLLTYVLSLDINYFVIDFILGFLGGTFGYIALKITIENLKSK